MAQEIITKVTVSMGVGGHFCVLMIILARSMEDRAYNARVNREDEKMTDIKRWEDEYPYEGFSGLLDNISFSNTLKYAIITTVIPKNKERS